MTGAVSNGRGGAWRLTRGPFGKLAMRWVRKTPTLAPLIAAPPTETISAMAAAIVRAYEQEHEWETMDPTDVTVCARLNGARAAL